MTPICDLKGSSWILKTGSVFWCFICYSNMTYKGPVPTRTSWSVCPGLLHGHKMQFMSLTTGFDLHPKAYCYFVSQAAGYEPTYLVSSRSHNLRGKGRALPSEEHHMTYFKRFSVHIGKDYIGCRSIYVWAGRQACKLPAAAQAPHRTWEQGHYGGSQISQHKESVKAVIFQSQTSTSVVYFENTQGTWSTTLLSQK